MKVFQGFEGAGEIRNAVVTTGSFDGVHIGHKAIIDRINAIAQDIKGESVLITFHPHPRMVLFPETAGKELRLINTQKEKRELLEKAGLDNLIVVPFTKEFSKTSSSDFIRHFLLEKLHARVIVIGFNHHFGHNREGDYEALRLLGKEHGFGVEEISERDIEHETVSSTKIRQALSSGNIGRANAYLDHQYIITGPVGKGNRAFAQLGFEGFSVGIEEEIKLIPPDGTYAVSVRSGGEWLRAMAMIGRNEEQVRESMLEVHLLDEPVGTLAPEITLFFQKTIRLGNSNPEGTNAGIWLQQDMEQIDNLIF